jgi:serine O-acetyltransferase
MKDQKKSFDEIVNELSNLEKYNYLYHHTGRNHPMPSIESLTLMLEDIKRILFPGFFGNSEMRPETINYYIGSKLENIYRILLEQINRGFCFDCDDDKMNCDDCVNKSQKIVEQFIERLPDLKHLLSTDVVAAYNGDPAAKSYGETIFSYPSIITLTHHRIAHELLLLGVPLIPRIISEMAHSKTGIDIHPGAEIGEYFFIDHGTGVVIGETTIIGKNVRLYQGVTLGAKSFPLDENGKPIKGIPRHPIVEDDVIIYSGSTILGRITIGKGSVIGGNMWITRDVAPGSRLSLKDKI